jgi:hypothetical protein
MYSDGIALPIKDVENTENLQYITHHKVKTDFLRNDKSLIFIDKFGGTSTSGEGGNKMQVLGNRILTTEVDFASLKVITSSILMDKDNIYVGAHSGILVTPIKALGLNVKVFAE